jgi:hypothetical protein
MYFSRIKYFILSLRPIRQYLLGDKLLKNPKFIEAQYRTALEKIKMPERTEVINFLLSTKQGKTNYLEIGVRNPDDNFNLINADYKVSVDPGIEFIPNPVDFKLTSDEFFRQLSNNEILHNELRFDVIFIDGLHLAEQVNRDIDHALRYIKEDGFIVLHDCNPPTEWHARECFEFHYTGAGSYWNGTTWKAFLSRRCCPELYSCCINSDWGIGILSRKYNIGNSITNVNPFFEFHDFAKNRSNYLNLIEFSDFKTRLIDCIKNNT